MGPPTPRGAAARRRKYLRATACGNDIRIRSKRLDNTVDHFNPNDCEEAPSTGLARDGGILEKSAGNRNLRRRIDGSTSDEQGGPQLLVLHRFRCPSWKLFTIL